MGKEKLSLLKMFECMVGDHCDRHYRDRCVTIELKNDTIIKGHVTEYDAKNMKCVSIFFHSFISHCPLSHLASLFVRSFIPFCCSFTLADVLHKTFRQQNTRSERRARKKRQTQQQSAGDQEGPVGEDQEQRWVRLPQMLVSGRQIRFVHLEHSDNAAQMLGAPYLDSVGKRRNKVGTDRSQQQRLARKRKRSDISAERRAKFESMRQEAAKRRRKQQQQQQ